MQSRSIEFLHTASASQFPPGARSVAFYFTPQSLKGASIWVFDTAENAKAAPAHFVSVRCTIYIYYIALHVLQSTTTIDTTRRVN